MSASVSELQALVKQPHPAKGINPVNNYQQSRKTEPM